jgi:hypothetical protein
VRTRCPTAKDLDWQQSRDGTDQERVTGRNRLLDDAEYEIHALAV